PQYAPSIQRENAGGRSPLIGTSRPDWSGRALELAPPDLPGSSKRDPERQQDQSQIQPKGLHAQIEFVVLKFLTTRDIPWRVNLCNSGQPWPHQATFLESRDIFEPFMHSTTSDLDLAGPQGPWSHKAHVADKDVPQLRQFISGGRPHPASD